ncbi:squalene/phytoene synthase family protein [Polynucleobacter sp. JS-JIR-II-c23]|uniref:squalene/phytoene synthase family protein n=1 Tax=Polynucleobacter sp. JS-JIR-II-c23 TaxID=1758393 RepID=UPI002B23B907|nr:squalene/phytoene synthase family protein [Polynucleobacter sp. JS-JIR-II-c23]MEA9604773.1 squalene/phytoene synthase family protein [Polynucleobacter sp. JS-JIR-II-c23]
MRTPEQTPTLSPTNDLAYQKAILGSVSRTFALTIPLLPPSIEKVVGNTYLLCRIIDTIEDAADLSTQSKQSLSALFLDAVLEKAPVETFVAPCLNALKNYSNQDELDLISHTPTVLRILHTCSTQDQAAVSRCVSIMSEGMSFFHGRQNQAGLHDLTEFEQYCYVVAGVVGELLTTIFSNHSQAFKEKMAGHEDLAIAFGQALQMTNILKDSPEDKARGVSWKPINVSHEALLKLAYQKLQDSLNYILLIPKQELGMRRFCFLAFGLAVMTLSKIADRKEFDSKDEVKLSRSTVMSFYSFTKWAVKSDMVMKIFFSLSSRSLAK